MEVEEDVLVEWLIVQMNLNEADEGLKLKRERGAVRESIASQ